MQDHESTSHVYIPNSLFIKDVSPLAVKVYGLIKATSSCEYSNLSAANYSGYAALLNVKKEDVEAALFELERKGFLSVFTTNTFSPFGQSEEEKGDILLLLEGGE